jgi:hypothetical protein
MARFVPLKQQTRIMAVGMMVIFACVMGFPASLQAADSPASGPMMESTMASPGTATAISPAAANKPATNAPPAISPPPPEYFNRYGKILTSGDEPTHPLKLTMPFPDVGEVKIPNQDQLNMREKLEALAILSDDDIRTQLNQWPAYGKMKLADEGTMLTRIQQFKERRDRIAQEKAQKLGLWSTLTPAQRDRFEKEYWNKRLKMDRDLAKQFEPIVRDHESKMLEELFREFSSTSPVGDGAQVPKPSPSAIPPISSPAAQSKPSVPPTPSLPAGNSPVAQGKTTTSSPPK